LYNNSQTALLWLSRPNILNFDDYFNYFNKVLLLPRLKCITAPKKYCVDLRWEGNIKTGPFGTLIEYPALKNIRVCEAQNGKKLNFLLKPYETYIHMVI